MKKSYIVIPHSCQSGLALRQQPEMKEPYKSSFQKGYSDDFLDLDKMLDKEKYNQAVRAYEQHVASLEIIEIAIEYKGSWEIGDEIKEGEFEIADCLFKINGSVIGLMRHINFENLKLEWKYYYTKKIAIPKAKEDGKIISLEDAAKTFASDEDGVEPKTELWDYFYYSFKKGAEWQQAKEEEQKRMCGNKCLFFSMIEMILLMNRLII